MILFFPVNLIFKTVLLLQEQYVTYTEIPKNYLDPLKIYWNDATDPKTSYVWNIMTKIIKTSGQVATLSVRLIFVIVSACGLHFRPLRPQLGLRPRYVHSAAA